MKERIKTIIAFTILVILVAVSLKLSTYDLPEEVYPTEQTQIRLYGEAHGCKPHYNMEFKLWKERYDMGDRALFVELPYYGAEFLNLWMQSDSDEILDQFFVDIEGTASDTPKYRAFLEKIKEECPETVFYGTDVGHASDTMGARYLEYLEEQGLSDSENTLLAKECIQQGEAYREHRTDNSGKDSLRETYMVENFLSAYERCGGGNVMGIYGSYHTVPSASDRMGARIIEKYGDKVSCMSLNTVLYLENKPYRFGFCLTGLIMLLMLFTPNIFWGLKAKPEGYEEVEKRENKVLLAFERVGEVLTTTALVIFPALNPFIKFLPLGVFYSWKIMIWAAAMVLMVLYEFYWIRYFRSPKTLLDQYRSFAGFPLAGASLPVIAVFLLGLSAGNLIVMASAVILGIGHIGIHYNHRKEALAEKA